MSQRRRFDAAYKARVAVEAIKGEKTLNEIASQYEVHPNQVSQWKKQALEHLPEIMADGRTKAVRDSQPLDEDPLHRKIGQQAIEIDFLKKSCVNWDCSTNHDDRNGPWTTEPPQAERASGCEPQPAVLQASGGIGRHPDADGLDRPGVYGVPLHGRGPDGRADRDGARRRRESQAYPPADADDGADGDLPEAADHPADCGTPQIPLFAAGSDPGASGPGMVFGHHLPTAPAWVHVPDGDYGLRQPVRSELVGVEQPRFAGLDALDEALRLSTPGIFHSDQGKQYTCGEFIRVLRARGIQISLSGRGRCFDNILAERLWRTVKYEEVYLREYADGHELIGRLRAYFAYYNEARPHQALGYRTPAQVYASGGAVGLCLGSEAYRAVPLLRSPSSSAPGPSGPRGEADAEATKLQGLAGSFGEGQPFTTSTLFGAQNGLDHG